MSHFFHAQISDPLREYYRLDGPGVYWPRKSSVVQPVLCSKTLVLKQILKRVASCSIESIKDRNYQPHFWKRARVYKRNRFN